MDLIRMFVEYASFSLCLFSLWVMATPKIKTGVLSTVGFGVVGFGFFGVGYVLIQEKDIVYRPMLFIVSGFFLIAMSVVWNLKVKHIKNFRRADDIVFLLSK